MIYTLEELQSIIAPISKKYNLPAVYVFGSYARGNAMEKSDVDILVDATDTNLKSLFSLGELYCDLEDALGKAVNLVTVSSLYQKEHMPS